jgi:uncharacterized protein
MKRAIVDLEALVQEVLRRDSHIGSLFHGPKHWKCVAWAGLHLAPDTPGCDAEVLFLFSLFHDSQRQNDSWDPEHGQRAGLLASYMHGEHFQLEPERLDRLKQACDLHADGRLSDDPTLAVCWDADRLNLWRVGMTPEPKYLSTPAARAPERIEWARDIWERPLEWDELYAAYSEAFRW